MDSVINCILDDGLGFLWFSSFQGIFRVSKQQLNAFADRAVPRIECVAYGLSNGLPALDCPGSFQPAGCRTRDGRLWFPTIKGLVGFNPARVTTPSAIPIVLVEEVRIDGVLQPHPEYANPRPASAPHPLHCSPFHRAPTSLNSAIPA